jgi:transposase-like protein
VKNGQESISAGVRLQRYRCNDCGKRFNERSGTPMSQLRAPRAVVAMALNSRTKGTGARATGRIFGKSHSTILRWEGRLANHVDEWTIHFTERSSRYWVSAMAGQKDDLRFQRGTQQAWQWAQAC